MMCSLSFSFIFQGKTVVYHLKPRYFPTKDPWFSPTARFLEELYGVHRIGQNLYLVQGIKGLVFKRQGVVVVAMDEVQTMIHLGDVGIPGPQRWQTSWKKRGAKFYAVGKLHELNLSPMTFWVHYRTP